jgi:hypothetical protein
LIIVFSLASDRFKSVNKRRQQRGRFDMLQIGYQFLMGLRDVPASLASAAPPLIGQLGRQLTATPSVYQHLQCLLFSNDDFTA